MSQSYRCLIIPPCDCEMRNFVRRSKARLPRGTRCTLLRVYATPERIFFQPKQRSGFAAYRFGCFARVDRFGHLCNQCCFKLLDIFQVITFWQLEWIVFCNAWGAVKHLWTLWFWRKDREVVKVQRFETVRAKLAVSGACPCSNPIMVYLRTYQQDVLNVEGRNIAFWDL